MPNFPIVDAHLHLWDPTHFRMPWLDDLELLNRPYGLAQYREQTRGVEIAAMVYLQVDVAAPYGLLEAQWVVDRAKEDSRIKGLVAYAPIEYGDQVRAYLDALRSTAPGLLKGIRRLLQGESDPEYCLQPGFVRGVQLLPEYGLSFDLCIYQAQMPSIIRLVRQCPNTSFILDHLGKPNIREHVLDPWQVQIRELAALPNVVCKVSGIVTEADHRKWTPADLAPYVDTVLGAFGEDRVVFGGDWPVATQAASYPRWIETLDGLTAGLSPAAKRKLWAENARAFYRLAG